MECVAFFENLPMKVRMPALAPARKGVRAKDFGQCGVALKVTKIAAGNLSLALSVYAVPCGGALKMTKIGSVMCVCVCVRVCVPRAAIT